MDDHINKAVLLQELRGLETFRQFDAVLAATTAVVMRPDRRLIHAGDHG